MQKWRDFTLNPDLELFFEKLNLHSQMSGAEETWSPSEGARTCQFENCPSALSFICLWCLFGSCRCLDLMPLMKSFDFFFNHCTYFIYAILRSALFSCHIVYQQDCLVFWFTHASALCKNTFPDTFNSIKYTIYSLPICYRNIVSSGFHSHSSPLQEPNFAFWKVQNTKERESLIQKDSHSSEGGGKC